MNIAWTNFFRFIYAIQSICCTVPSTSCVFLPSNTHFPNLSQWIYFFGGTCVNGTIAFSEGRGLILGVVLIYHGREFIFPVLQFLGNWSRRLQSNSSKRNFWRKHGHKNVIYINATALGNIMKRKTKTPQSDFPNSQVFTSFGNSEKFPPKRLSSWDLRRNKI